MQQRAVTPKVGQNIVQFIFTNDAVTIRISRHQGRSRNRNCRRKNFETALQSKGRTRIRAVDRLNTPVVWRARLVTFEHQLEPSLRVPELWNAPKSIRSRHRRNNIPPTGGRADTNIVAQAGRWSFGVRRSVPA